MIKKLLLSLALLLSFPFSSLAPVAYGAGAWKCTATTDPTSITSDTHGAKVVIDTGGQANGEYGVVVWDPHSLPVPIPVGGWHAPENGYVSAQGGKITYPLNNLIPDESGRQVRINIVNKNDTGTLSDHVKCKTDVLLPFTKTAASGSDMCAFTVTSDDNFKPASNMSMSVTFVPGVRGADNTDHKVTLSQSNGPQVAEFSSTSAQLEAGGEIPYHAFEAGTYLLDVPIVGNIIHCSTVFNIDATGGYAGCLRNDDCKQDVNKPYCLPSTTTGVLTCQGSNNGETINPCVASGKDYKCQTAIGAMGTSASAFAKGVLQLFLGLGGIILLFIIILNGYKFMTSQGDPEKVKEARESITAAIAGLLVIIFSIVILQFITIDVLHLPGFN